VIICQEEMEQAPRVKGPNLDRVRAGVLPVEVPPTSRGQDRETARDGRAVSVQEETRALDKVRGKAPEKDAGTDK